MGNNRGPKIANMNEKRGGEGAQKQALPHRNSPCGERIAEDEGTNWHPSGGPNVHNDPKGPGWREGSTDSIGSLNSQGVDRDLSRQTESFFQKTAAK